MHALGPVTITKMQDQPIPRNWTLPEEPLSIRLMNTIWADTAGAHDDLLTAVDLDAWLDAVDQERGGATAGSDELESARALRDALRRLAAHATADDRANAASAIGDPQQAVDCVNATVAALPAQHLAIEDGSLTLAAGTATTAVAAALARVAEHGIEMLGGPQAAELRACHAPGCVLYFLKTHPRREWCSVACGNRARAARHYRKHRASA